MFYHYKIIDFIMLNLNALSDAVKHEIDCSFDSISVSTYIAKLSS